MQPTLPYQLLSRVALLTGLLIAVFFTNAVPFLSWVLEDNPASSELCEHTDNEPEKEEKKVEDDPDDKIQNSNDWPFFFPKEIKGQIFQPTDHPFWYHPEIHTPPPERGIFLS